MTHTGAGLDLFRGDIPIYTLTFAKGLSPTELLYRMGADPDTLALRDPAEVYGHFGESVNDEDEPVVVTGVDGAWAWAWELSGEHGLDERIVSAVSRGTEAVVLYHNEKPMHWFKYAVDGDVVVDFNTLDSVRPTGLDPSRLDAFMHPLGLIPEEAERGTDSVLCLAENAFGLRVTPAEDGEARWSGSLLPLSALSRPMPVPVPGQG
ncbi:DUF6461 domain-containing protein [Streptomyces sp. NPDC048416]|uniref:DUF6461 domain-containing protein n=1 Tax=Streptomyces sp. NPDC048416 TaxID=3365546 RepID=UPI003719D8BE